MIPFTIGRFYRVPTVRARLYQRLRDWPVIGPQHEDAQFINFPHQHVHVDWRFVCDADFKFATRAYRPPLAVPLCTGHGTPNMFELPPPMLKRRVCRREMPQWPLKQLAWLRPLEDAFAGRCLKPGLVCPHRGFPLKGLPPDADGVVTCPGHGLSFNAYTGLMVRRSVLVCGGQT